MVLIPDNVVEFDLSMGTIRRQHGSEECRYIVYPLVRDPIRPSSGICERDEMESTQRQYLSKGYLSPQLDDITDSQILSAFLREGQSMSIIDPLWHGEG